MLEICKKLFLEWNNSVNYCHWKSNEHLGAGLDGLTDLDILMESNNREKGVQILRDLNFIQCNSQYGSRYPYVEDWIGFDMETGSLVHIHLHFMMVTGHRGLKEYNLPWGTRVLETKILNDEYQVYISDPNYELVTLYTRIGLKSNKSKLKKAKRNEFELADDVKKEIAYLKKRISWVKVRSIVLQYYEAYGEDLLEIMHGDNLGPKEYISLNKYSKQIMKRYSRFSMPSLYVKQLSFDYIFRIRTILRNHGGCNIIVKKVPKDSEPLTIAFIGQDGSGKSTVASDIEKWLMWKLDSKRFYLGSGENYKGYMQILLQYLSSFYRKNIKGKNFEKKDNLSDKTSQTKQSISKNTYGFASILYDYLTMIKYKNIAKDAYKNVIKANKYAKKGGIPIFDRFPQIEFKGIYDGPKIYTKYKFERFGIVYRFYSRLEKKYINKIQSYQPALVFKLILPPEESIRRKPFDDMKEIRKKAKITKELLFDKSLVYEIDAMQSYSQELIEIKRIIWDKICRQN